VRLGGWERRGRESRPLEACFARCLGTAATATVVVDKLYHTLFYGWKENPNLLKSFQIARKRRRNFESLSSFSAKPDVHVGDDCLRSSTLKVTVGTGKRGVYLRQLSHVSKKTQWAVTVKPILHEDEHNDKRVRGMRRTHWSILTLSSCRKTTADLDAERRERRSLDRIGVRLLR